VQEKCSTFITFCITFLSVKAMFVVSWCKWK